MQAKSVFVLSALVLAAGSVFADQAPNSAQPLTRAEVRQSVVDARANGELRPAGEAGDEVWTPAEAPRSTLTRAEVVQQVAAARAAGQLAPAGEEGDDFYPLATQNSGPGLSRAQVVAETLRARNAGLLEPAGRARWAITTKPASRASTGTPWPTSGMPPPHPPRRRTSDQCADGRL